VTHSWSSTFDVLDFFKVDLCLEPYSTTFSDLLFRNVRLNRHIEVRNIILRKNTRRWKINGDCAQYVHNLSYFQSMFEMTPFLLQNRTFSKIALHTRRKICGLIVRQAHTILSFRFSTLASRVCLNLLFKMAPQKEI